MNRPVLRISLILVVAIALLLIGKYTSVGVWFNLDNVSNVIRNSGPWGFVIFILLFILGSLMHIPAMLFILVAIFIYGHVQGALFGYLGVVIAMTANYLIIRKLGNKVLHQIPNKRLQNMLSRLQRQPLLTVILDKAGVLGCTCGKLCTGYDLDQFQTLHCG